MQSLHVDLDTLRVRESIESIALTVVETRGVQILPLHYKQVLHFTVDQILKEIEPTFYPSSCLVHVHAKHT